MHYLWEPLGKDFQTSLDISGELCISYSCISFPISVQVSGRTYHRSVQTYYSSCILLDGGFLSSHSSQHVGRYLSLVSYCKRPFQGWLGGLGAQGTAIAAF